MKKLADILILRSFVDTLPRTDLVSRQRLRLFKIATLLSLLVSVGFLIQVLYILPGKPLLVGCMFALFCGVFVNYFAILFHKNTVVAYIFLLGAWFILIHFNAYFSGGVKNSGNFYLATLVLTAFMLLGTKGGKITAALSILHVVYFYFITTRTHFVSYDFVGKGEELLNLYFLFSTSVSLFVLAAASNFIDNNKKAVVESLHLKNEELVEASNRLQLATAAAKIGIWDWDISGNVATWDATMYALHGVTNAFVVNYLNWENLLHPDDRLRLRQKFELIVKKGQEYEIEYRIIWADNTIRFIKASAQVHRDDSGRALRILGTNLDITESKKAEEAIIHSNKRYELATKATSNAIWEWNLLTGEYFWSEAYQLSFGYQVKGLNECFETFVSRIHSEDSQRVQSGLLTMITGESGDYWEDEYRFLKADGSIAHVYNRGYLVLNDQNRPISFVGAMEDITARKGVEMERELIIKELIKSNADLKQFSYITSHNLRAPLSNISAILGLINPDTLDAHNTEMLGMLNASGNQLVKTIDDLTNILLIKNNRSAKITRIDIHQTLNEINKSFSALLEEAGGRICTVLSVPYIRFHQVYLESLFINLISNSIKYRSPDRNLVIKIENHTDLDGNCILTFSDNGLGIDMKRYKDRIFGLYQRFHKTSEGQGLGLFIIKSQVESLGGEIALESEVDKGCTFTVTFKKPLVGLKAREENAEYV